MTAAAQQVRVGGVYVHYKSPDMCYKVTGLGITTDTDKVCVIYEALYGERITFVRPLNEWLDEIETPAGKVSRFTLKE